MRLRQYVRLLLLVLILALGMALSGRGVVLAQAQPQLVSRYLGEELPLTDPTAPLWDTLPALEVPLTAQSGVVPALLQASIPVVRVRSVHNGQWITFLLEWDDQTRDMRASRPDEFRDAAAIQIPVDTSIPGVCMGVRGKMVNLWHWKADWQADIDEGFRDVVDAYPNFWKDYYPFVIGDPPFRVPVSFNSLDARAYLAGWAAGNPLSDPVRVTPVEELTAEGFGTATHKIGQQTQHVLGRGVWKDGKWRVVFSRPLALGQTDAAQFVPGATAYVAFAVWNGSNQEVGARKQLSADVTLLVEAAPAVAEGALLGQITWPLLLLVGLLALVVGALVAYSLVTYSKPSEPRG
jgi:hypothetical protein